ncbi:MAG: translation initiation factor IF-3 [Candidatus Harrisonbacteria bacterium CG10_big_fil_rev_8_21_14_0_10_44_23]|uniref:Translation initiation factor IF-3 n=1 Tax=Candidatus Harrisonbacteria bacterium CG10_big_fil_rev_8_21_14_0_10_44_23 TaxID=1974585 RepID=A0A2H0UQ85_9BACT|nr:MAG: translation initiation factor IF-3 [Candidatus Harrisonbacteria bacterium CG10_big_fil_rev_8_21_14_0_10_44_23]
MRRGPRKFAKPKPTINSVINDQIRIEELMVVGSDNENLGLLSREAALAKAKEAGLDLVLIAAQAKPPVAKIISFDKWRYQEEKKIKKQRSQQKSSGQKQVQISVRAQQHDLETKVKRADKFLAEGNRVEILMRLRGRENKNMDFARNKLEEFLTLINPDHTVLSRGRGSRGGINAVVAIKK